MLRLLTIPAVLILLLAGAITWSGLGSEERGEFRFINRGDIITLDPNQMSWLQDIRMAYAIWEGLYTYEAYKLTPIPGVASSVDVSPDSRIYTFHLRPEAKWSNGDPCTTRDFIFAWKRMLDEPGDYTYLHYYIKGAEQYVEDASKGLQVDFKNVGVEALDEHTLRVTLTDPVTFFLDLVAFSPFLPLNERSMEPFKEIDPATKKVTYNAQFTRPPNVVGNGPFVLKKWDFKRRLFLEQNPYYWDKANVKCKTLEMIVCEDRLTQLMLYESGDIHWLAEVSSEVVPEMLARKRPDLHNFGGFGTAFLTLMVKPTFNDGSKNPLADKRIRQALSMAIEREQICKNIMRCGEKPGSTFIPPDIFEELGWQSTPAYTYNPKRAKELLTQAGYPNGGSLPGVSYLFRSGLPVSKQLAENYARQWKQVLNLDIPLNQVENKTASQMLKDKDYSMAGSNWSGDYMDPSTFTDKYLSTSINNDSGWVNAEYDALLRQAAKESDAQKRLRLLEQAERILNEELPIIPLYHLTNQYMFRDNVKGVNTNPRHMTMFKAVEVIR